MQQEIDMTITLTAEDVKVEPLNGREITVVLTGVSLSNDIDTCEIVKEFGEQTLLKVIGEEEIINYLLDKGYEIIRD